MKNVKTWLMPIGLGLILLQTSHAQESLALYSAPDIYSTKVETIRVGDPRLGPASPVLDEAKAALGWQYADFIGPVTGYVPDAKIGKDLLPVDNCLVRAKPGADSAVLCVYNFGDPIEVLDTGPWWKVRIETTFPVYFVAESPAPLPPVTGEAAAPLALAEVEEAPAADVPEAVLVPPAAPVAKDTIRPRPGVVGQSYEGVFRKAKRRFGLLQPKEEFLLEGPDGKRLAWVKLEGAIITGSIKAYFDQPVIIHGERIQIEDSRQYIIYARNIRPRN